MATPPKIVRPVASAPNSVGGQMPTTSVAQAGARGGWTRGTKMGAFGKAGVLTGNENYTNKITPESKLAGVSAFQDLANGNNGSGPVVRDLPSSGISSKPTLTAPTVNSAGIEQSKPASNSKIDGVGALVEKTPTKDALSFAEQFINEVKNKPPTQGAPTSLAEKMAGTSGTNLIDAKKPTAPVLSPTPKADASQKVTSPFATSTTTKTNPYSIKSSAITGADPKRALQAMKVLK